MTAKQSAQAYVHRVRVFDTLKAVWAYGVRVIEGLRQSPVFRIHFCLKAVFLVVDGTLRGFKLYIPVTIKSQVKVFKIGFYKASDYN
jgi:hypothetical protein